MTAIALESSPRVLDTWTRSELAVKAVLVGTFVNKLGAFFQTFLVLFLTHRGFTEVQAGVALGCFGAGGLVGVLSGGALADRLGPRLATLTSMSGSAGLLIAVLYIHDLAPLLVAVSLVGIVGQLYRPASAALLSEFTSKDRQVMIFALYRWALNLGTTVAPLLGAALITVSYNLLFWSEAAAALAFAAIAAVTLPRRAPREAQAARDEQPFGYREVLADRRYLRYLLAMGVNSMVYIQYVATLPLAMRDHGLATAWFSVVIAVNGFLVITCELLVTKSTQHRPIRQVITAGFVLLGAGYSLYALPIGVAAFLIGTLVWTAAEIVGGPTMFAYPGLVAPDHLRARYIGAMQVMFSLGSVAGPAAGVALYRYLGDRFWLVSGAVCILALAFALSGMRRVESADD
jgi:predicted MFS family arabinose efflux permease